MTRLAISCVVLVACGASPASGPPAERRTAPDTTIDRAAAPSHPPDDLDVRCEDDARCPLGVAMIVGPPDELDDDGHPNRCTGALVANDRVLTASHCLPASARRDSASCRGTWIAFPGRAGATEEWVECDRVVLASAVDDREVLRPDCAVVKLVRPVERPALAVDPTPPPAHSIMAVVAVTPHAIYRSQHAVGTRLCRVRTAEEAVELFGAEAARVGWLSDCPTYAGNSGAPILDRDGRVRGILHGGGGGWPGIGVTTPPPRID